MKGTRKAAGLALAGRAAAGYLAIASPKDRDGRLGVRVAMEQDFTPIVPE